MKLSPEQLARASRLLDEIIDADAADRRRWLDALAPEDRDLEAALRRALLPARADADANAVDALLAAPPRLGDDAGAASGLQPGDAVGPWRLARLLGAGGMAEVWLAERADGAFKRTVALKVPARPAWRPDVLPRFAIERDILAALEHPHIARFYDAGVSADGRPYLVLEHVAGTGLLEWADRRELDRRGRIELLLQVLQAVQYAHEQGVVHRDIKPSNVLVTPAGQVKLLDFGVATLIERAPQPGVTQAFGSALTPGYASPEQLAGESADAASDVYALGVVLHELLTGHRPHEAATRGAATGAARDGSETHGARALPAELRAIVQKAIAPARAERYPSAAALAADLRRHLAGEPIGAMPDTLAYRSAKFVTRNRLGVAVAAALGVAVGTVALQLLWPLRPSHAPPPDQTSAAAAPALRSGSENAAPPPGEAPAPRPRQPNAAAELLVRQGEVYANGPYQRDAQRAEVAFKKAIALDPGYALPWARLALLHLRQAAQARRPDDERLALARQAIDQALAIEPDSMAALAARFRYRVRVDHQWSAARAVLDRMRTLDARDPVLLPECEALFAAIGGNLREAIQIQRQAVEHDPRNAAALGTLALYLFHDERIDEATALLRRELALNPHAPGSRGLLAVGLALRGHGADALAETAHEPHRGTRLWAQAIVHTLLGRRAESDAALAELRRDAAGADAYRVAQVYALRARPQPALEWLNRACGQPPSGCETLRIDRFFAGLRDDARLRALLARLKLDGEPPLPAR